MFPSHKSHCVLLSPVDVNPNDIKSRSFGIATVSDDGKRVYYPSSGLSGIRTFDFTGAVHVMEMGYESKGVEDQTYRICDDVVGDVCDEVVVGCSNACIVIAGCDNGTRQLLELGPNGGLTGGLYQRCVDGVRQRMERNGRGNGKIVVSWYDVNIDNEGITDVLKLCSGGSGGDKLGGNGGNERGHMVKVDPGLVMRDEGIGAGVSVTGGLWEIQVEGGEDVRDIIAKVRGCDGGGGKGGRRPGTHRIFNIEVIQGAGREVIKGVGWGQEGNDIGRQSLTFVSVSGEALEEDRVDILMSGFREGGRGGGGIKGGYVVR